MKVSRSTSCSCGMIAAVKSRASLEPSEMEVNKNEPRHDKTNKMTVRPSEDLDQPGHPPRHQDWSESSLGAWRKLWSLAIYWAHSEDSDQTGRIPRLIWVFAGRTVILLVLPWDGSNIVIVRCIVWVCLTSTQYFVVYPCLGFNLGLRSIRTSVSILVCCNTWQAVYGPKHYVDRVKRIWYLSPMRAAKVQASLRIRAVSPEPSLLAHTSSESRGTFRQKARSLAPLNGWACAVKLCHDGMLEDTNSLDGAHVNISSA